MVNPLKSFQKKKRGRRPNSLQKAVISIIYTSSKRVHVCVCLFLCVAPRVTEREVLRHTLIFLHNKQASISRGRLNSMSAQQTIAIFFTQAAQTERCYYLARQQQINRKDISSTLRHILINFLESEQTADDIFFFF